mgnify:CR=1 FL=1
MKRARSRRGSAASTIEVDVTDQSGALPLDASVAGSLESTHNELVERSPKKPKTDTDPPDADASGSVDVDALDQSGAMPLDVSTVASALDGITDEQADNRSADSESGAHHSDTVRGHVEVKR